MRQAALGFRVHSGWTALVAVAMEKGSLSVLARARPRLVETFTYEFRQPYHTAEKLPLDRAHDVISRSQEEAHGLALLTIREVRSDLGRRGFTVRSAGLLAGSGRRLPELAQILGSHALIHAAEGELFRQALLDASERCRLATTCVKESELMDRAAQAFRLGSDVLLRRVTELGRPLGAPWSQDEKLATLVAWLALSRPNGQQTKAL